MATATTQPMTKAERKAAAKERKANRPKYPVPEGGLVTVGADYDPNKFQKLGPKDFNSDASFLIFTAEQLEAKAKRYRAKAADQELMGDSKNAAKMKKLLKLQRDFADLKAQLSGDNVDVEKLLASLNS